MRARQPACRLRDLWPDVVDNITSGVRAGLALPEALSASWRPAGRRSCGRPFAAFAEDYRATGRFHDCLDRLKERLSDPVGDRLVESLRIAREVGGSDLGRLLRTLSAFLREDARTRAELETRQAGPSTRPGWRWPHRGSCWRCCAPARTRWRPTADRAGIAGAGRRWRAVARRLPGHGADRAAARGRAGAAVSALAMSASAGAGSRLRVVLAGSGLGAVLAVGSCWWSRPAGQPTAGAGRPSGAVPARHAATVPVARRSPSGTSGPGLLLLLRPVLRDLGRGGRAGPRRCGLGAAPTAACRSAARCRPVPCRAGGLGHRRRAGRYGGGSLLWARGRGHGGAVWCSWCSCAVGSGIVARDRLLTRAARRGRHAC